MNFKIKSLLNFFVVKPNLNNGNANNIAFEEFCTVYFARKIV